MTTKPKARKFRIRRAPQGAPAHRAGPPPAAGGAPSAAAEPLSGEIAEDGAGADRGPAAEIDAIRREGLTGRQLRMARRVAQKHGLAVTSDFDAVRQLRARGIDPFQRANMLELVVPGQEGAARDAAPEERGEPRIQLPQTTTGRGQPGLPSTELNPADLRAQEIMRVQRDIARRRRRKALLLLTRLAFFVFLPTLLAGWYFYVIATPMYATKSEFLILKADAGSEAGMGGLLSGTQFATNQDAIAVQSFLQSKDAMLRLDADEGFKAHFSQPWIDPIQRMPADASNEEAYSVYKRNVEIGFDPTEGIIRMEVSAADPEVSARFSEALIGYAEERVDSLSRRKRENQVSDAQRALEEAEAARRAAQERLVELQQEGAILDPEGRIAALRGQINNIEMQIQEKQLELAALLDNARPNAAKVEGARGDIRRLEGLLAQVNAQMTEASQGQDSLAALAARIQLAQADVATRDLMLQSALEQLEQSRRDANAQVRYLTTSVMPVAPQDPSYPRAFENTVLAFLIFSGIYLMISLTASILREQVSS